MTEREGSKQKRDTGKRERERENESPEEREWRKDTERKTRLSENKETLKDLMSLSHQLFFHPSNNGIDEVN